MSVVNRRPLRRWRALASSIGVILIVALSFPVGALASISSYTIGAQTPSPVEAGNSATYSISVVAGGQNHGVTVTAVAGLPAGATFQATCGVGSSNGGQRVPIILTIQTTAGTTPGGTVTIRPTVYMYQNTTTCGGGQNDISSAQTMPLVIAKADATVDVSGYTGAFDGAAHGATGTATGAAAEDLSSLLDLGASFTDVPGGTADWAFAGNAYYNSDSGSVAIVIAKADATVDVSGYTGAFDGAAHGATGTATGAAAEDLSSLLDLGASFTDVPGGTADWAFAGNGNYNSDSGSVAIVIAKADATVDVSGYTGAFDGAAHGATGTATGAAAEDLSSLLDLGASFTDVPGGTADWAFAGNGNYNSDSGSVAIVIAKADATVDVSGYTGAFDGAAHGATGTATGAAAEDLSSLLDLGASFTYVPGGTAHWAFAGNGNYNSDSGSVLIDITSAGTSPFTDIADSMFKTDIIWLFESGITSGCSPTLFCPTGSVTRGQMAAFLDRALKLPPTTTDFFTDDDGTMFEASINRLAAAEITTGCTPTTFCPTATVRRDEMASFLTRAFDLPSTTTDFFTDDTGNIHEININRLAASGITTGCSATTFCPSSQVSRGQMAAFLHRALTIKP